MLKLKKNNSSAKRLTFRHRASCILVQAFRYSPENALHIFNQQIYFIIWYLLDRASLMTRWLTMTKLWINSGCSSVATWIRYLVPRVAQAVRNIVSLQVIIGVGGGAVDRDLAVQAQRSPIHFSLGTFGSFRNLTLRRRIKSHLPFAGIIRRLPYSTRFQDKG